MKKLGCKMLKVVAFLLTLNISLLSNAQYYEITFTAFGVSLNLDSVLVENITQGTNCKLLGVDTLLLDISTSINDITNISKDISIYPNPSNDKIFVGFYAKQTGSVKLNIISLSGKIILQHEDFIELLGHVKYEINGIIKGNYIMNIVGNNYNYNSKFVSNNEEAGNMQIRNIGNNVNLNKRNLSPKLMLIMPYNTGDVLQFTGYSNNLTSIVNDIPTSSKTIIFDFTCGNSYLIFTYNDSTETYGTVVGHNNICWLDRNLGAYQVADSSADANAYGDLFQWGRGDDGHQIRTSGTTPTLSSSDNPNHSDFILVSNSPYDWRSPQNDNLWQGASGINNPCPSAWRLPTEAELDTERVTWGANNSAGAFDSPLKLTVAGHRNRSSGSLSLVGSSGYYWSFSRSGTYARGLLFDSSGALMIGSYRANGFSVRCLRDY